MKIFYAKPNRDRGGFVKSTSPQCNAEEWKKVEIRRHFGK